MNLEEKIRIKDKHISIRDLICTIPIRYDYKKYLSQDMDIEENVLYKFCFTKNNIIKKGNKIFVNGELFNKEFTIVHNFKLYSYFNSQDYFMLEGKIQDKICFFPKILKNITKSSELNPIYSLESNFISTYIEKYLDKLPENIQNIFRSIHLPNNTEEIKSSLKQLMLYELSLFINNLKQIQKVKTSMEFKEVKSPFKLTPDQESTWSEIQKDFQQPKRSIRLVHGEVGSGKTLIAFLSAMYVAQHNKQVCIMAPTSLLAQQIYDFFMENNYLDLKIAFIQSKIKKKDTDSQVFIGTQALLYKDYLKNIGLMIIDEQHKFGVLQRNKLIANNNADVIMLSATPIPRTFKMVTRGYIQYSTLQQAGIGGKKETVVASSASMKIVVKKMLQIASANKIVWVCKTIEQAEERFEEFQKNHDSCFLIHSKIKNKNDILAEFDQKTRAVLVSTTVIEVGIDIDLKFIFIEDADLFGLSQIHQLRGRIARRPKTTGVCVLIGKNLQKLKEIKNSTDGFSITQLDIKNRGGGLVHGTSQSGFESFNFTKTIQHLKLTKIEITDDIVDEAEKTKVPKEFLDIFQKIYTEEIIS